MTIEQLFLGLAGLLCFIGGAFAPPFFMNHPKAQFMVKVLGWNGTRTFYMLLGIGAIVAAVFMGAPAAVESYPPY